jgi:hypothetical protein
LNRVRQPQEKPRNAQRSSFRDKCHTLKALRAGGATLGSVSKVTVAADALIIR